MNGIFRSEKHYFTLELVNPLRIIQNYKIQEIIKIEIRNPNLCMFKEDGGKSFIIIEGLGEVEVKETLEEILKKLQDFAKDFNKDFDEFIQSHRNMGLI